MSFVSTENLYIKTSSCNETWLIEARCDASPAIISGNYIVAVVRELTQHPLFLYSVFFVTSSSIFFLVKKMFGHGELIF